MISDRTSAALAAYEDRKGSLETTWSGGRCPPEEVRMRGLENAWRSIRAKADAAYAEVGPMIVELRAQGLSYGAIADVLNANGHTTQRGKAWMPAQVLRVLRRFRD